MNFALLIGNFLGAAQIYGVELYRIAVKRA